MKSSLEKRLASLKQKHDTLGDKIKKMEEEKAKELRKINAKKASLIGNVVMQCLEQETPLNIKSEDDLLAVLDAFLTRKTERAVFGLQPLTVNKKKPAQKPKTQSSQDEKETVAPFPSSTYISPVPQSTGTEKKMANEFNLG